MGVGRQGVVFIKGWRCKVGGWGLGFGALEFGVLTPPLPCFWVLGLGYCTRFWSSYFFLGSFGHGDVRRRF
jgi:hypothetical protein